MNTQHPPTLSTLPAPIPGSAITTRPRGAYGLWEATLVRRGASFTGYGHGEAAAIRSARRKAENGERTS